MSGTGPLQHPGRQRDCSAAGLGARVLFSIWCDRAARVLTEAGTLQAGLVPYRQQHQQQLEAAHVPGAVLPELVEAELVRGRAQRTLTLSDKVLLGDRAPCSAGAATVLHEPRLCGRA